MALYPGGVAGAALDDVAVEGSLHEELGVLDLASLLLEGADKLLADDLALRLGVRDPRELVQKTSRGVHVDQGHLRALPERLDYLLGLVVPQKTVVYEDARKVVADGPVDEHRGGRRVHPAREPADSLRVADLLPYLLYSIGDDVDRRPLGLAFASLEEEVLEDLQPVIRVSYLRVELHPVAALLVLLEGYYRDGGRLGGFGEALWGGKYGVAVGRRSGGRRVGKK